MVVLTIVSDVRIWAKRAVVRRRDLLTRLSRCGQKLELVATDLIRIED